MILNKDFNLLYIINPRVAATTISSMLGYEMEERPFVNVERLKEFYGDDWFHLHKFTFVRNPYTRIVSDYFSTSGKDGNGLIADEFDNWFDKLYNAPRLVSEPLIFGGRMNLHKPPQVLFINEDINYVGRFEMLKEHWTEMLNLFGLGKDKAIFGGFIDNDKYKPEMFKIPHTRVSGGSFYTVEAIEDILWSKTIGKINLLYKDDFDNPYFSYKMIKA